MKTIILSILISITSFAYSQNTTDILHLKNGSVLKGKIIEENMQTIKIELADGNIFAFSTVEVDKKEILKKALPGKFKTKGYYNYTSMGMLLGSSVDDKQIIFSILMEHHFQINRFLGIGAITGIELFNEATAPIGGNIKLSLPLKEKSMLFCNISNGYSFALEEANPDEFYEYTDTKGGAFANAEVGLVLPSNSYSNFFFAVGYRYNELNYKRQDWYYDEIDRKITYNRFSVKLGVVLH